MCLAQMSVKGLFREARKEQDELRLRAERLKAIYLELLPFVTALTDGEKILWREINADLDALEEGGIIE